MNKEEWRKLPIGTICIYGNTAIIVKTKQAEHYGDTDFIAINAIEATEWTVGWEDCATCCRRVGSMKVAPKWIQELYNKSYEE